MPKTIDIIVFYLLSLTWGILMTLVGFFAFLGVLLVRGPKALRVRIIKGRIAVTVIDGAFGGISLGMLYMVGRQDSPHLHMHELGHTYQNIWWGPLFPFVIGIPSVIRCAVFSKLVARAKAKGKILKYDDIWFEGQATSLGYTYAFKEVTRALLK